MHVLYVSPEGRHTATVGGTETLSRTTPAREGTDDVSCGTLTGRFIRNTSKNVVEDI